MSNQYIESPNQNDLYALAALIKELAEASPNVGSNTLQIDNSIAALKNLIDQKVTQAYVDNKVSALEDTMGAVITEVASMAGKLSKVVLPDDTRYYLTQDEIDFIRDGMSTVSQKMVELEQLKNELIILSQQML